MVVQLNSQVIYYEREGEGSPVILLHGNGEDHTIFDELFDELKKTHTVYAMDSRNHGMSGICQAMSYDDLATDVVNMIEGLQIDRPILVGFSDGGIVALLVAINHSELISKIVVCSANLSPKGIKLAAHRAIKKQYKKDKSPITAMMLTGPDIKLSDLAKISVPAVVLAGSNDCIKESETKAIADGINNSKLYILPGEDHSSYVIHSTKILEYI